MNELVSLVVPIYNGEKYVERFFEIIKNQTYEQIEVIFVDDGSTDTTLERLVKIAGIDKRIRVFEKENGGPSSARNFGISKAEGDYIAFADIDDYLFPDYIKYMYELLIHNGADIAFCSYIKRKNTEKYLEQKQPDRIIEKVFSRDDAIKYFCYRKFLTGYSYLKLCKTKIVKEVLFDESIVYGEDFIFSYELLKKCTKVVYGNKIQYIYIQYQDSSTHVKRDNTVKYRKAWIKHLGVLEDVKIEFPEAYNGILGKCYILAINNTTRIYDKERDGEFNEELYQFIKDNAPSIACDKFAKMNNRILGIVGAISPKLVCFFCARILLSNIQCFQRRTT